MTKAKTTQEFINQSIRNFGDKFDYRKVNYKDNKTKVLIGCKKCNIFFEQTPTSHLNGNDCLKCSIIKSRRSTLDFENQAVLLYGDNYDYSKVNLNTMNKKVIIHCNRCKSDFNQFAKSHLEGHGCQKCSGKMKLTKKEFIRRSILLHGGKYNYDKVIYKNSFEKIIIYCK